MATDQQGTQANGAVSPLVVPMRRETPLWKTIIISGAASCFSEICTVPLDTVKVRLQVQGKSAGQRYNGMLHAFRTIWSQEGTQGLFKGYQPALLRQATYGSTRLGLYPSIKRQFGMVEDQSFPVYRKVAAAVTCGAIASAMFTPCDVVKVRMQADASGARYTGLVHAFATTWKEEGLRGLYTGVSPTVQRAATVAGAELATYDVFKTWLLKKRWSDGIATHTCASLGSGLVAAIVSSPADVIKSRVMSQPVRPDGVGKYYRGTLDCVASTIRKDGLLSLWKGLVPNYLRLAPNVVLLFVSFEQFSNETFVHVITHYVERKARQPSELSVMLCRLLSAMVTTDPRSRPTLQALLDAPEFWCAPAHGAGVAPAPAPSPTEAEQVVPSWDAAPKPTACHAVSRKRSVARAGSKPLKRPKREVSRE